MDNRTLEEVRIFKNTTYGRWGEIIMGKKHLGMIRPIRQFEYSYKELLKLIEYFENVSMNEEEQREVRIKMLKQTFNDCLVQLNNIKNTQIEYLKIEPMENEE